MIAIIKENYDSAYISHVFAIRENGWRTEVIAFDKSYSMIKRIKMWEPRRSVYIIQNEEPFTTKRESWEGYDWILDDKHLRKRLRFGKSVSIQDFPKFKPFAKKINLPEWLEITNENDINTLMDVAGNFHDAILRSLNEANNTIEITFDTTWDAIITVRFEDVAEADIVKKVGMIYDSEMTMKEEGICWTVTGGYAGDVGGIVYYDTPLGKPFIKCKKILWNIEVLGVNVQEILRQMSDRYNTIDETKDFQAKWDFFKECHKKICEFHKDDEVFIYASDCEFEYLMTLLENDGPEYSARVVFGDGLNFYEMGVCVRGTPILKRIELGSKETKQTIKNLWGKVGIYFDTRLKK